jgi:hypothetical protein
MPANNGRRPDGYAGDAMRLPPTVPAKLIVEDGCVGGDFELHGASCHPEGFLQRT